MNTFFLCEHVDAWRRCCTAKTFSDALWCAEGTVQSGDAAIVARWVRRGVGPLGDYHRGRPLVGGPTCYAPERGRRAPGHVRAGALACRVASAFVGAAAQKPVRRT